MERKDLLYLGAVALLLFLFGSWLMPVTDPVESNYVETAKEMIAAGECGAFDPLLVECLRELQGTLRREVYTGEESQ